MNSIFKNMLSQYSPTTKEEKDNATHEVMQQIALAGLILRNALSLRDKNGKIRANPLNPRYLRAKKRCPPIHQKCFGNGYLKYRLFFTIS